MRTGSDARSSPGLMWSWAGVRLTTRLLCPIRADSQWWSSVPGYSAIRPGLRMGREWSICTSRWTLQVALQLRTKLARGGAPRPHHHRRTGRSESEETTQRPHPTEAHPDAGTCCNLQGTRQQCRTTGEDKLGAAMTAYFPLFPRLPRHFGDAETRRLKSELDKPKLCRIVPTRTRRDRPCVSHLHLDPIGRWPLAIG